MGLNSDTRAVCCLHPGPAAAGLKWLWTWGQRRDDWSRGKGKLWAAEHNQVEANKGSKAQRRPCSQAQSAAATRGDGKGYTLGSLLNRFSHWRLALIMLWMLVLPTSGLREWGFCRRRSCSLGKRRRGEVWKEDKNGRELERGTRGRANRRSPCHLLILPVCTGIA